METNELSHDIRERLADRRKATVILAGLEGLVGNLGLGVTILAAATGHYAEAVATGIPTLYLLSDCGYTMQSLGERPFHLLQTVMEKYGKSRTGHTLAQDIEAMIKGESEHYALLDSGIAQPGDIFYTSCRVPGVIESARVVEADTSGFDFQFNWGGLVRHTYGNKESGVLQKILPDNRLQFYRETA
jgi:hypothetical protein